jgi:hypothetical protein
MMDRLNMLKQYMDFAKENGIMGPDYSSHNGFNPTPYNPSALAAQWAERQIGNQQPDFFGGGDMGGGFEPSKFARPERYQGQMPQQANMQGPMTGQIQNYLARFLGGR